MITIIIMLWAAIGMAITAKELSGDYPRVRKPATKLEDTTSMIILGLIFFSLWIWG